MRPQSDGGNNSCRARRLDICTACTKQNRTTAFSFCPPPKTMPIDDTMLALENYDTPACEVAALLGRFEFDPNASLSDSSLRLHCYDMVHTTTRAAWRIITDELARILPLARCEGAWRLKRRRAERWVSRDPADDHVVDEQDPVATHTNGRQSFYYHPVTLLDRSATPHIPPECRLLDLSAEVVLYAVHTCRETTRCRQGAPATFRHQSGADAAHLTFSFATDTSSEAVNAVLLHAGLPPLVPI